MEVFKVLEHLMSGGTARKQGWDEQFYVYYDKINECFRRESGVEYGFLISDGMIDWKLIIPDGVYSNKENCLFFIFYNGKVYKNSEDGCEWNVYNPEESGYVDLKMIERGSFDPEEHEVVYRATLLNKQTKKETSIEA